jgi:hypothetical protein
MGLRTQVKLVKSHIWVLYTAAYTTARLGLATPQPLPVAWVEGGVLPPAAEHIHACNPLSFVVSAYHDLFAVHIVFVCIQVQSHESQMLLNYHAYQ